MKRPPPSPNEDLNAAGERRADSGSGIAIDSIRAQLGKVLAGEPFSHSERLCRFLRFTVEEAIQGRAARLKEYQIGVEVFDKKGEYDPRIDPIVRVEAGRLRSKLEEYYRGEGRNDPVLIKLKKGGYAPVFERAEAASAGAPGMGIAAWLRAPENSKTLALLAARLAALLVLGGAILLFVENLGLRKQVREQNLKSVAPEFSLIWGRFLAPGANNLVIFGSPVFFASDRESLFLRWQGLSEMADYASDPLFQRMQQRFGPLSVPRHDYASMGDALALQRLTAFLARAGVPLAAVPANLANWEALQDSNVIFLGAPRMIPLLARLPAQQDFEWDANHNVVNRKPQAGEQATYATASHYDEVSYAVVARFPGLEADRQILLITAHSAPGIVAAVDHLTQPERVKALAQKLGLGATAEPRDYQVLIRVLVDKGSRVKSEYVTHHRN
jgi:hypothetical protein